jgi:hypothetical protein
MKAETKPRLDLRGKKPGQVAKIRDLIRLAAACGVQIESDAFSFARTDGKRLTLGITDAAEAAASTSGLHVNASGIVVPSTVLGIMPTIGGTALDAGTPPALTITGTGTEYVVVTVSGTPTITTLSARDFFSGMSSVTCSIAVTGTLPTTADLQSSSGTFKFLLATFVAGVKTAQIGHGPITGEYQDSLDGTGTGELILYYTDP